MPQSLSEPPTPIRSCTMQDHQQCTKKHHHQPLALAAVPAQNTTSLSQLLHPGLAVHIHHHHRLPALTRSCIVISLTTMTQNTIHHPRPISEVFSQKPPQRGPLSFSCYQILKSIGKLRNSDLHRLRLLLRLSFKFFLRLPLRLLISPSQ